ncbi:MAG: Crp/Fnr family transcriptional regulator [Planctomycetaceae bacterium]|nr:Crp/Fnr family transcriptional regulator [Planctomycetaceae bacterium]
MKITTDLIKQYLGNEIEGLSEPTLSQLAAIAEVKDFNAGEILSHELDDSINLMVVISGQVDIQYMLPNGKRETVDTCFSGDFLGWSSVVPPHKTNSIDLCRSKAEVLAFNGEKLRAICAKDTGFGFKMMSFIARVIRRRLHAAQKEIVHLR